MGEHQAGFIDIKTLDEAEKSIVDLGSDPQSIDIMAPKLIHKTVSMKNIMVQDAVIIKQDMLSIGGEVAIPKDAFYLKDQSVSILISGTYAQLLLLIQKLKRHYPRIQRIADELQELTHQIG
jgi:dihydropteroate synthase